MSEALRKDMIRIGEKRSDLVSFWRILLFRRLLVGSSLLLFPRYTYTLASRRIPKRQQRTRIERSTGFLTDILRATTAWERKLNTFNTEQRNVIVDTCTLFMPRRRMVLNCTRLSVLGSFRTRRCPSLLTKHTRGERILKYC